MFATQTCMPVSPGGPCGPVIPCSPGGPVTPERPFISLTYNKAKFVSLLGFTSSYCSASVLTRLPRDPAIPGGPFSPFKIFENEKCCC